MKRIIKSEKMKKAVLLLTACLAISMPGRALQAEEAATQAEEAVMNLAEAVEAMEACNKLKRHDIENDMHVI